MKHTSNDYDEMQRTAREHLLARGAELRDRVTRVRADLRRELAALPADAPDAAVARGNDAALEAIGEAAQVELDAIEKALRRIDADMFAVCESCGRDIELARLDAVPYTTYCGACVRDA
jgi:RNA polymerase-binding transcription factor DksA